MIGKYTGKIKGTGRRQTPEKWFSGPDPIEHEKYYAWQKHRAQANFRGEHHSLSWSDWQTLWPTDQFLKRGRKPDDLCLIMRDFDLGWTMHNVSVVTRREHLQRKRHDRS